MPRRARTAAGASPMPRPARFRSLPALAVLQACAAILVGLAPRPAPAENLARGRAASFTRSPDYPYCTDPGDSLQLTDGELARARHIWLERGTVAWKGQPGDVIGIRIDLGRICRLDSVRFFTAAFPPAGIVPPALVCARGGPESWEWAGALAATSLPEPAPGSPQRVILGVPMHGDVSRHILVGALLRGPYLAVDEIEVHGSEVRDGAVPARSARASRVSSFASFRLAELPAFAARQRRLWAARAALPDASVPAEGATGTEEALRLASRARAWRAAGAAPIEVRRVDPWAPTTPWSAPLPAIGDTLQLAAGAWGAAAAEIACAAEQPVQIPVGCAPAGAGTGAPRTTLREVVCVEARDGGWAGDALPLARDSILLRPGEVRQIWVDVDARGAAPGLHRVVLALGPRALQIPVRVHALRLPASPLAALDWTYPLEYPLTSGPAVARFAVHDNVEHGIDTWCLTSRAMPWPDPHAIDARGHIGRPLDFAACDSALALHAARQARRVGWYWDLRPELDDPSRGRFSHPFLSRPWRRAVSEWLAQWLAHLRTLGYDPAQLFMAPFDEATGPQVVALLRFLKQEQPALPLALTVSDAAPPGAVRALQPWVDVLILGRSSLATRGAGVVRRQSAHHGETWTYSVPRTPKTASPRADYRLLAWEAWARGLQGCAFWAYGDAGSESADAWNDFDGERTDFTIVYGAPGAPRPLDEPLAPSKRWQAFRIGLQEAALLQSAAARLPDLRRQVLEALAAPGTPVEPLLRRVWRTLE